FSVSPFGLTIPQMPETKVSPSAAPAIRIDQFVVMPPLRGISFPRLVPVEPHLANRYGTRRAEQEADDGRRPLGDLPLDGIGAAYPAEPEDAARSDDDIDHDDLPDEGDQRRCESDQHEREYLVACEDRQLRRVLMVGLALRVDQLGGDVAVDVEPRHCEADLRVVVPLLPPLDESK